MEADLAEMTKLLSECTRPRLKQELEPWLKCQRQLAVGELRDDRDEMSALLALGGRRVAEELQPWMDGLELQIRRLESSQDPGEELPGFGNEEAEQDHREMIDLLSTCRSSRVRLELEPWLEKKLVQTKHCPQLRLPTVVIVGADVVGTSCLLRALAGLQQEAKGEEGSGQAGEKSGAVGTISTKYYRARVRFCTVDPQDSGAQDVIRAAGAVILLWQQGQPDSFEQVRRCCLAAADGGHTRGVQLCVAAAAGDTSETSGREGGGEQDDVFAWCLDNAFEYLRCPLADADLEKLRERRLGTTTSSRGGLLDDVNSEDTVLRIADALECCAWEGSEPIVASENEAPAAETVPASNDRGASSLVVVAGAPGLVQQRLAEAFGGDEGARDGDVKAVLKTKYYKRQLLFKVLDVASEPVGQDGSEDGGMASLLKVADGVILVWDAQRPETFKAVQQLYDRAYPKPEDVDGSAAEDWDDIANCSDAVQICIAVEGCTGEAESTGSDEAEDAARAWCAERFFEYLQCRLGDADLKAVSARWRSGARNTSLQSQEDEADGPERIVEALECHTWAELEWADDVCEEPVNLSTSLTSCPAPSQLKGPHGSKWDPTATAPTAQTAERPSPKSVQEPKKAAESKTAGTDDAIDTMETAFNVAGTEEGVDAMENCAEAARKVRDMPFGSERQERAAELAMRMAKSFGLEDSDSD